MKKLLLVTLLSVLALAAANAKTNDKADSTHGSNSASALPAQNAPGADIQAPADNPRVFMSFTLDNHLQGWSKHHDFECTPDGGACGSNSSCCSNNCDCSQGAGECFCR